MKKFLMITPYEITLAGIFLALMSVVKYFDLIMPKTPLGVSWWEIYWTVAVLIVIILPWLPCLLILGLSPLIWTILGQTSLLTPVSFIFDYTIPLLVVIIVKAHTLIKVDARSTQIKRIYNYFIITMLIIIAATLKFFSHTISGVIFYKVTWSASLTLNAPYPFVTMAISIVFTIAMYDQLKSLKKFVGSRRERY